MAAPAVNMLWIGERLGRVELLSIASWLACGHAVRLHVYRAVANVPAEVDLVDGELTVPFAKMKRLRHRKTGSYALASDYFRYRLQLVAGGLWSDLDVVCLKPVNIEGACLFGLEDETLINGAVLYLDAGLPMTAELESLFRINYVPPWTRMRRARKARFKRFIGLQVRPADLPWGTFGPGALTALAHKYRLFECALPRQVFYPLHFGQARAVYDPAFSLDVILREETLTLHLWNEMLRDLKHRPPPAGSPLAKLYAEYGV
ncbi:glycosyltransferase [Mesorhizobium sp. M00.F.Ca.ET.216.01.1.1]|uniref:glycosyltransferase n=1 Tax=Mesorhizobium sp. M00.F.Ca.ET.216.01.1.1 TaxID=2500528 RepID=UPI000FDA82CA|nr:glycosyltransferase [Mesorhizobium sp. M00.F.Ca.ET.216.01.1.1]TGQ29442.1 hypothetical protein EN859_033180 [Mesorhizobium sp. M00.F.Ca.ET.216.01.1.1]